MATEEARTGAMAGFSDEFADPVDYILTITETIWEKRGIDTLDRFYADDVVVRSPAGVVVGNQAVIDATAATQAEFPDRQLLGEDVIWSADPEGGFLSSHRILSTMTHTGDGAYGEATHARIVYRVIADCACRADQVYDEWLIRDQGAIVRCLGIDPRAFAEAQIAAAGGPEGAARPFSPACDVAGRYCGTGNDDRAGRRFAELLSEIMEGDVGEGGDIDAIRSGYDRAAHLELPGGETGYGWEGAHGFWSGLRGVFGPAEFRIHHQIGRSGDPGQAPRAALRWSLEGTHDGAGRYGSPSGAPLHVMGISHCEFGPTGLRREWTLIDDTEVWKQILLHTG